MALLSATTLGHAMGGVYPTAEAQSVDFTAPEAYVIH